MDKVISVYRKLSGWPEDDYGIVLYALVRAIRPDCIVEIGTFKGFSLVCMLKGLYENKNGMIYSFDGVSLFDDVYLSSGYKPYYKFINKKSTSVDFKKFICGVTVDIGFIDGSHSCGGCLNDCRLLWPRISKLGGLLILHDADRREVPQAIDLFRKQASSCIKLPTFGGLAIFQKGDPIPYDYSRT